MKERLPNAGQFTGIDKGAEMTVQMKDIFFLGGERFFLLAVSDSKLLSCKNCVGDAFGTVCTGCYRDSLAEYEVDDCILLLKENAAHVFDDVTSIASSEYYAKRKPPRCHPDIEIPFTGQLIICQSDHGVDFFGDIFKTSRAIELEFEKGLLIHQLDLADFIKAGRKRIETIPRNTAGFFEDYSFFTDVEYMMGIMREICPNSPRGEYRHSPYTLLFDRGECVLCNSIEGLEEKGGDQ